jgi:hypothetical protein
LPHDLGPEPYPCKPLGLKPWSTYPYDIAVRDGTNRWLAILELSYSDTNLRHAIHNGEVKLLGLGDAMGKRGRTFAAEHGRSDADLRRIQSFLASVPLKGLFFVGAERVLCKDAEATWEDVGTKFESALLGKGRGKLDEEFDVLSRAGLRCWFYSTCGEPQRVYPPVS